MWDVGALRYGVPKILVECVTIKRRSSARSISLLQRNENIYLLFFFLDKREPSAQFIFVIWSLPFWVLITLLAISNSIYGY